MFVTGDTNTRDDGDRRYCQDVDELVPQRASVVHAVACPTCNALPSQACLDMATGLVRELTHGGRWRALVG